MHVLLVDGIELSRESLRGYLERLCPSLDVMPSPSLGDACAIAHRRKPFDLILLALRADELSNNSSDGPMLLRKLMPSVPMAVLVSSSCSQNVLDEFAEHRVSVISMDCSGPSLLTLLEFVATGQAYVSPSVIGFENGNGASSFFAGGKPLTPRELDVLAHLSQGLSNKEIARRLDIEEVTVRLHLRGIFRKLGASNRTQAVKHAIERGHVEISGPDRPSF